MMRKELTELLSVAPESTIAWLYGFITTLYKDEIPTWYSAEEAAENE